MTDPDWKQDQAETSRLPPKRSSSGTRELREHIAKERAAWDHKFGGKLGIFFSNDELELLEAALSSPTPQAQAGGVAQQSVDPACSGCAGITHFHTCDDPSKGPQVYTAPRPHDPAYTAKQSPDDRPYCEPLAQGKAFYLAMYEHEGANWDANENQEVWVKLARDYERRRRDACAVSSTDREGT